MLFWLLGLLLSGSYSNFHHHSHAMWLVHWPGNILAPLQSAVDSDMCLRIMMYYYNIVPTVAFLCPGWAEWSFSSNKNILRYLWWLIKIPIKWISQYDQEVLLSSSIKLYFAQSFEITSICLIGPLQVDDISKCLCYINAHLPRWKSLRLSTLLALPRDRWARFNEVTTPFSLK